MKKILLMIALGVISGAALAQKPTSDVGKVAVQAQMNTGIAIEVETLEQYAGSYELMPNFNIIITVKKGKLVSQATGQEAYEMIAKGDHTFVPPSFPAKITFVPDADGEFSSLVLEQGGQEMRAPRVSD